MLQKTATFDLIMRMVQIYFGGLMAVLLLFMALTAPAQQCVGRLHGKITDDHTNEPLPGATVLLLPIQKTVVSDDNGFYRFDGLCEGAYTIKVTHTNCETAEISIQVRLNTRRDVLMHHSKVELQGVTIQGLRVNNTQVLERLSENKIAASRALNLGEVLRNVNGVTLIQTGSTIAKPVIHGLHSNRILIMNNGVRQEGQQWGSEHAPELDPYLAGRFSVLKGAAAVRYGADAIGGVVLVEPRSMPAVPGINGEFNGALLSNNLTGVANMIVEQKLSRNPLSWRAQATIKKGGNTRIPGFWLMNTGLEELNYSGTLSWKEEKWGAEFTASAFNTRLGLYPGAHVETVDELKTAISSPVPLASFQSGFSYAIARPRQEVQHFTGKLSGYYKWDAKTKLSLLLAHQENFRDEYDARAFITLPEMSLNLGTTSAELVFEKTIAQKHLLQTGVLVQRQENVNGAISARQFIRNFKSWLAGGFAIWQFSVNRFDVEAGARYDYKFFESYYRPAGSTTVDISTRRFQNASGSLGIMRRFSPAWRLRANAATAWRPPGANELYANGVHQGLASFEKGDPSFRAERAFNMNMELTFVPDSSVRISATVYRNRINDYIYLAPTPPPALTIRGYYPVFAYRQTDAVLSGLDVQGDLQWGSIKWTAKGSLLFARDIIADDWLIFMPANRMEHALEYQVRNRSESRFKNVFAGINWQFVDRQRRIPDASVAADYALPPAAYHLFGLDAGATRSQSGVEWGLSVFNLFNTRYRDYLNRLRYFTDAAGINVQLRARVPIHFKKS